MQFREYRLSSSLSKYIEAVWLCTSFEIEGSDHKSFWIPNGCTDLVFNLGSPYLRKFQSSVSKIQESITQSSIIGQMKSAVEIELGAFNHVVGIRFKPYGLYAFTGMESHEFTDKSISSYDVFGKKFISWSECFYDIHDDTKILAHIEQNLQLKKEVDSEIIYAADKLIKRKGMISIKSLLKELQISQRSLETKFKKYIGITPKELSRIYRFNGFFLDYDLCDSNLTCLAYEMDYFDQSHLIHDFKSYVQMSPQKYIKIRSKLDSINKISMERRFKGKY